MKLKIAALLLLTVSCALTQTRSQSEPKAGQANSAAKPTVPKLSDANPSIVELAVEDQWDRGNDMFGGRELPPPDMQGKSVGERDVERENAVRKLLAGGTLTSGTDFWLAALIFQHSAKPDSVLLAHVLASTAVAKGNQNSKWLAAASLDRYLWYIGQAQIFGTQFQHNSQGNWTMEPYARDTLSDAERATWCVVPIGQQENILLDMRQGRRLGSTSVADCQK